MDDEDAYDLVVAASTSDMVKQGVQTMYKVEVVQRGRDEECRPFVMMIIINHRDDTHTCVCGFYLLKSEAIEKRVSSHHDHQTSANMAFIELTVRNYYVTLCVCTNDDCYSHHQ